MSVRSSLFLAAGLAALAAITAAQPPHVRNINFYGLHKISAERALRDTKLRPGEPLPASRGELEDLLAKVPGVIAARVEAVCCEGPDTEVFIGIEERGGPKVAFRSEPTGEAALPEELTAAYNDYLNAVTRAGSTRSSSATREAEQKFAEFAQAHLDQLRDVLRNSAEPEQRAIAATALGFAPRTQAAVDDLQYALQDPDESVRGNALGSLRTFALLAVKQPGLKLQVAPTWLIELLNSIVLGDRMQAADLLLTLTDGGDRAVLDQIHARALPSLVEMARWESLRFALPPFLLVGRVAGLPDSETQRRWSQGEREPVIEKALGQPPRKR